MSKFNVLRSLAFVFVFTVAAYLSGVDTGGAAEGEAQAAAMTPGEQVFSDSCSICHSVESNAPIIIAPNLFGVVGRPSAAQEGYFYSSAMRAANLTWDEVTLSAFLTAPQQVVPGTSMGFVGFLDPGDTQNVIAYLKTRR